MDNKGSVTVFLVIIFLCVCSLVCVLVEIVRIEVAQNKLDLSLNNAVYSLMSIYDNNIKETYGLFGYNSNENKSEDILREYLDKNNTQYSIRCEDMVVEFKDSLDDIDNFESQILEYIKYRGPSYELMLFLEKAKIIKATSGINKTFSKRLAYERKASELSDLGENLNELFNGKKQSFIARILGYDYIQKDEYMAIFDEEDFAGRIQDYIEEYDELTDIEEAEERDRKEDSLSRQLTNIVKDIKKYKKIFKDIRSTIDDVSYTLIELENMKKEYKSTINTNKQNMQQFDWAEEYSDIEIDFIENNSMDAIDKANDSNIILIEKMIDAAKLVEGNASKSKYNKMRDFEDDIVITPFIYDKSIGENKYKKYDNRNTIANSATNILNISNRSKTIPLEVYNELPSNGFNTLATSGDIEFLKESSMGFSDTAFNKLSVLMDGINTEGIRNKLLVDEYIISTFKHVLSGPINECDNRFRLKKTRDSYLYNCEIEYIIGGKQEEIQNLSLVKSKILLIRFGFNTIHVFTCKQKVEIADATAIAVGGMFTGGAGIPIIKSLILMSWSMAESVYDVQTLTTVEKSQNTLNEIPLIKTEEQWVTKLSSGTSSINNEGSKFDLEDKEEVIDYNINLNYIDYLRLLLFIQNKEISIRRIQDLIIMNTANVPEDRIGGYLDGFKTSIEVESVASMKYLWIFNDDVSHYLSGNSYFRY